MEARTALEIGPFQPRFTIFEVKGRSGPSQESHPLAFIGQGVPQLLAHQIGILEIVVFADQTVPKLNLLRSDNQMHLQRI